MKAESLNGFVALLALGHGFEPLHFPLGAGDEILLHEGAENTHEDRLELVFRFRDPQRLGWTLFAESIAHRVGGKLILIPGIQAVGFITARDRLDEGELTSVLFKCESANRTRLSRRSADRLHRNQRRLPLAQILPVIECPPYLCQRSVDGKLNGIFHLDLAQLRKNSRVRVHASAAASGLNSGRSSSKNQCGSCG